jgi:rod shape-determining protein MreB
MLTRLRRWLCPDLAIDLGTANTQVVVQGRGLVVDEPSVVALQTHSRRILGRGCAVGKLARQMFGKTPEGITTVRPLRDGVINDFELCEAMLRYFLRKATGRTMGMRPRSVIAVPGRISPVERRAVFNSAERAGAGRVYLVSHSVAAAVGAGLPVSEPLASMVCDIGSGVTDIAVFSMADIVAETSVRIAGDEFDAAIVEYLRRHFALQVGTATAEQVKLELGSANPLQQELATEVRGRDVHSGIPRRAMVTSEQVREAVRTPLARILNAMKSVIEQCDPELVADLVETGLVLTGGGSQLREIDSYFSEQLNIPVRVAADPATVVVRGAAICCEHLAAWKDILDDGDRES